MESTKAQFNKMTETPVSKLVFTLSIPTIISMLVTNIYNIVDTAFVGTLGTSASGAIGIVFGYMAIIQAVGFTFGQGSGSIISRMLGNKDSETASMIASTGVFFSFIIGILISIFCFIFLKPLIYFLGSTSTIYPYARQYIMMLLIAAPFMTTSFVLNNILRFEGRATFAMIGLLTGAILNIGLDALMIFVFKMGIIGAALATAISQLISFFILLSPFIRGKTECSLSIFKIYFNFKTVFDIIGTGLPSFLRQGLNSIATILLNMLAGVYGDAAIAGMSISNRLFFFFFSVVIGIGQGFQPVCGYNYGAKRIERVKKAYYFTIMMSEIFIVVMSVVMFVLAPEFVKLLRDDAEVIVIGSRALRLQCVASVLLPFCVTTEMLLQSTGTKFLASLLSAFRGGLIFIPVLLIASSLRGLSGIQEAQPLAHVISLIPAIIIAPWFFKKLNLIQNNDIRSENCG